MAKYIELVGIPGIGKTTTCNYLQKKFHKQLEFYFNDDINLTVSGREFLKKKILRRITSPFKTNVEQDKKTNHLQKFVEENQELTNRFWEAQKSEPYINKPDFRFNDTKYTANIFEKVHKVKSANSGRYFIVDEGLIHCINNFISETSDMTYEQHLNDILSIISLPNGVVFFGGDVNIAVERTIKRKYKRERDKNINHEELLELRSQSLLRRQICMDLLIKKNVPVLYLDASDFVETKAAKIMSFVHDLE